jgi:hypothetical protein
LGGEIKIISSGRMSTPEDGTDEMIEAVTGIGIVIVTIVRGGTARGGEVHGPQQIGVHRKGYQMDAPRGTTLRRRKARYHLENRSLQSQPATGLKLRKHNRKSHHLNPRKTKTWTSTSRPPHHQSKTP